MTRLRIVVGISQEMDMCKHKSLIKNDVARWYFFIAIGAAAAITAIEYVQSD